MLMSALRALVNNLFCEYFDITFIENLKKKTVKILITFFFFSYKNFL